MFPLDELLLDALREHILVAVLGWLLGLAAGAALGYGLAIVSLKITPAGRQHGFLATLIPWRTILAGLVLLTLIPLVVLAYPQTGMRLVGTPLGLMNVAFVLFLIGAAVTVEIVRARRALPFALTRGVAWARSLAVLSVVISTYYGFQGGGGLGFSLLQAFTMLRRGEIVTLLGWTAAIALAIDLVLGVVQFLVASRLVARTGHPQRETV